MKTVWIKNNDFDEKIELQFDEKELWSMLSNFNWSKIRISEIDISRVLSSDEYVLICSILSSCQSIFVS